MNTLKTIFAIITAFFGFQSTQSSAKDIETKPNPTTTPKAFRFVEMIVAQSAFNASQLQHKKTVRITSKPGRHDRVACEVTFICKSECIGWSVLQSASGQLFRRRTSDILGFA